MKKIEAIIRKSKFGIVKRQLIAEGISSFNYHLTRSISENSEKRFYRGVEYDVKALDRIQLSLYIKHSELDKALSILKDSGNTGDADDNYIYIMNIEKAYQLIGGNDLDKLKELK